jgi:hypothetical protein
MAEPPQATPIQTTHLGQENITGTLSFHSTLQWAHVKRVPEQEGLGGRSSGDYWTELGRIVPPMLGYRDKDRSRRWSGHEHPYIQLDIRV